MIELLLNAKNRLVNWIDSTQQTDVRPLATDQWIANSLLQKSIRRRDVEVAQRAALTFYLLKGSAIWRRFIVIAHEDMGAAAPEAVAMAVAASSDIRWRERHGGDRAVVCHLARLLAEAPKSRSTEHLITGSNHHPDSEGERLLVCRNSLLENLATVCDRSKTLSHRALAAWCASGIGWRRESTGASLPGLLDRFRRLGVPEELVESTGLAAARSREAIVLMVPLVWDFVKDRQVAGVLAVDVHGAPVVDEIPLYALDKHTRIGREAIRNLVKHNLGIRQFLKSHVEPGRLNDAAYMAAFYADAAPLASKVIWKGADELEALGTETDMVRAGVPAECVVPLIELFKKNIPHLNKVRIHTVYKKRGFVDFATALMAEEE